MPRTERAPTDVSRSRADAPVLGSPHPLKLAVFSPNIAGGANLTFAPEALQLSWPESRELARLAEAAGFEAIIPVARWRGMSAPGDRVGHRTFEPFTWAAAVAAVTERIGVFATVHVPLAHPVAVAKQAATVDHVSGGRFALNVVAGWNADEFAMFGLAQRDHDDRYDHADEWVRLLRETWTRTGSFDFAGRHMSATGVISEPKPLQHPGPVLMNAGFSPAGRAFAARHADIAFALIRSIDAAADAVADLRGRAGGRELSVFAAAHVVCAATDAAAEAAYDRMVHEHGDLDAARTAIRQLIPNSQSARFDEHMAASAIAGFFALPLVGSPATVVDAMAALSGSGVAGLALSWLDYPAGIRQYRDELRPLLVRAGLRKG